MRANPSRSSAVRRATLAIASVAVVGTVAAGCGSSSKGGGSAADLPSTPASSASQQPPVTETPSSTPSSDAPSSDTPSDTPSPNTSARSSEYKNVLLDSAEVTSIVGDVFTGQPSDDSDDDDTTSPSGCAAIDDFVVAAKDSEQGKAAVTFTTADQAQSVEEQLTYVPEQAADLFTQLKDAVSSCDTLGTGGDALELAVQSDPEVEGADATLSFTASKVTGANSIAVTASFARFGDTIVQITYSAVGSDDVLTLGDPQLLIQAAGKAESVLA